MCVEQPLTKTVGLLKFGLNSGDQAFIEKAAGVIFDRSNEENPKERLSPCVPIIQEFHAEKVL